MRVFGHLHRLHLYSSTFSVLVRTKLLRSNIGIHVRSLCARIVHSVGPSGNVSAVLCVGRRVQDTDELQAPVFGPNFGESDSAVATEGTHCVGLFEFGRQCSFAKNSARHSSVEFPRLSVWRSKSVAFGPIIHPFPDAAVRHGGDSGGP